MKNPCNNCIVKSCCTQLCKDKEDYRKHLDIILDGLHPHAFSKNRHQRRKIPYNIYIHWEKKIKLQKINHEEINRILGRIQFMQNPCKTCLLVNNCTVICEAKRNLQTLLKQTMHTYQTEIRFNNNPTTDYVRRYNFWQKLKLQNDEDMLRIILRARKLKQDNL